MAAHFHISLANLNRYQNELFSKHPHKNEQWHTVSVAYRLAITAAIAVGWWQLLYANICKVRGLCFVVGKHILTNKRAERAKNREKLKIYVTEKSYKILVATKRCSITCAKKKRAYCNRVEEWLCAVKHAQERCYKQIAESWKLRAVCVGRYYVHTPTRFISTCSSCESVCAYALETPKKSKERREYLYLICALFLVIITVIHMCVLWKMWKFV